ncbi:MAG TPA: chemotaxis protein CheB [Desulfosporosinus sp.]|nr:chemotaxis protein CheB [Desulfosporosinus sp.]
MKYDILAIGGSAGGINALKKVLHNFRYASEVAIIIIQHLSPSSKSYLRTIVSGMIHMNVYEIEDKMQIKRGTVFIAPPNYHVLIEKDGMFTLTVTEKVCFARPSIDVTFESIADTFGESAIGMLLTGANQDGGQGLKLIREAGGYTIVQNPNTAEAREMPEYAIKHADPNEIIGLEEIGSRLNQIIISAGENR